MWVLVSLLFFFSGATSLVYETLWIRVLSLAVGSTSAAMSLVLALFFLGLSVGSWLSTRVFARTVRPLKVYALLEGLIGISSLILIYGLVHFHRILAYLPLDGTFSWLGTLAKFVLAGILVGIPTVAMGATLPLVVRVFSILPKTDTRSVSLLYAINTFGAVFGTLLASFVLIPSFGILVANHLCVATNLALLAVGLWLDRRVEFATESEQENAVLAGGLNGYQISLIALSGVCGFSSIASEVVWNKYLGIFLGNNIYGLGIVLGIYLFGIALGSLALYFFLPRIQRPERFFWILILSLPVLISGTSYGFNAVPILAARLSTGLDLGLLPARVILSSLLLLPFTALLGILFPLTVHLLSPDSKRAHQVVGLAYAVNTIGAILGSCLAGLVLIPLIGSSHTIRVASALLVLGALALWWQSQEKQKYRAGLAVAALIAVLLMGNLDFRHILQSAYMNRTDLSSIQQEEFRWIREGETSIITLSHDPADGTYYKNYLRLKTNGLNESVYQRGSLDQLPRYEALLGLLPYLFSDAPRTAFVVGFGGGYTVDLLTQLPLGTVHVVELEKAILEAADYAYERNNPVVKRKNLDLRIEDARFVLAAKLKAPLDMVVSQPSHSWLAGAANLFTREFFEIVRSNLSESGVFSQWLNLYNMDVTTLKSILNTFYEVFPHGAVFSGQGDQEMILIGSRRPLRFNVREAARIAASPEFQRRLANVPFNSPTDVLSHFALSRDSIRRITKGSPLNTDINAYAETRQSRTFYSGIAEADLPQAFLTRHFQGGFADILDGSQEWAYSILVSLQQTGQYEKFFPFLTDFENRHSEDPRHHAQLGYLCLKAQRYASAERYLKSAFRREPTQANLNLWIYSLVEQGSFREASRLVQQHKSLSDKISECYWVHSQLGLKKAGPVEAVVSRMAANVPDYTEACGDFFNRVMGDYYYLTHRYSIAIPFYEAYEAAYPGDPSVLKRLSVAYLNENKWENASDASQRLTTSVEGSRKQLESLAQFYEKNGLYADAQALQERRTRIE